MTGRTKSRFAGVAAALALAGGLFAASAGASQAAPLAPAPTETIAPEAEVSTVHWRGHHHHHGYHHHHHRHWGHHHHHRPWWARRHHHHHGYHHHHHRHWGHHHHHRRHHWH